MENKLTARQDRFCAEYVIDHNQTRAAIRAGYSAKSAASIASDLVRKPAVRDRIAELEAAALERAGITLDRVLTELARIGLADIRKVVRYRSNVLMEVEDPDDEDGAPHLTTVADLELIDSASLDEATAAAIAEVSLSANRQLKVKLHPKAPALAHLLRHLAAGGKLPARPSADVGKDKTPEPEKDKTPPPAPPASIWDDPPDGGLPN